jgi:hypothetical protein
MGRRGRWAWAAALALVAASPARGDYTESFTFS